MQTAIIIFSKDRTLQLKSLILSIKENTDIPEKNIYVIYKNVNPDISYDHLIESFPKANFLEQGIFLHDIEKIVNNCDSKYIQWMVDDLIIRDTFSYELIETLMDDDLNLDAFCLRMGRNIKCGTEPQFEEINLKDETNNTPVKILLWNTSKGLGKHWNYFWDVSDSIYRKELVLEYFKKCRPKKENFPNPFEDHFYQCMPNTKQQSFPVNLINVIRFVGRKKNMKIACFEKSKCFTQGVNLVADIVDPKRTEDHFTPIGLHQKMLDGYIVDFKSLKDVTPEQPNAGHSFFKLVKYK